MAWYILLGYVVATEVILFVWIYWSCSLDESNCLTSQVNTEEMSPIRKIVFFLVMGALMFVSAPFVVPVMVCYLVNICRAEFSEVDKIRRMFKELLLHPLHPSNMPEGLGAYIEEHHPAATAMGFESLGDYWLKEEPFNSKGRLFLSADQLAFAEIGVTMDLNYCEVVSFLEDGSIIGSANVEPFRATGHIAQKGYHLHAVGNVDMLQLIESHFKFVEKISNRTNQPVRMISREDWKDYFQYHNQKYGQIRFELGETDTPPVKCEFPNQPAPTTPVELTTST